MKRTLLAIFLVLLCGSTAYAGWPQAAATGTVGALQPMENFVRFVVTGGVLENCPSGYLWFSNSDKAMMAAVLAAKLNNKTVSVYYENNVSSPLPYTGATYGAETCRVRHVAIQ